ncbi:MAG: hypothetical protein RIB63_20970, partial [Fulvivirga sp.]
DTHEKEIISTYTELYDENKAKETLEVYRNTMSRHRSNFYVSCWSGEDEESYALWKIYLNGQDGVSIKTDFQSLQKAFKENKGTYEIGKVEYTDQLGKSLNPNLTFKKRKYYQYENEIRIAYYSSEFDMRVVDDYSLKNRQVSEEEFLELNFYGFKQKVDLDLLIKEIRISPFSKISFERLIVDLLEQVSPSLVKKVTTSKIKDK